MISPETITRLNLARSLLTQLRTARSNPNHVPSGPHGGEFTSGVGGKHAARKRKRLKARKRKLEQWRKEGHQEIAELRAGHKKDRKELIRDQAKERKQLIRGQVKERNALRREHKRDKTKRADRREAHAQLRSDQKGERKSLHEDHATDRASTRQLQHDDRREIIDRWVSDIRYEFPKSRTGRPRETNEETRSAPDQGPIRGSGDRPVPDPRVTRDGPRRGGDRRHAGRAGAPGRLSARATHKASSAEAILSHCLRRRGWSARFRAGRLTGRQHLVLLEDIRQYGRSWLRHEAEAFFRANSIERGLTSAVASAVSRFFDRARSFIRELLHAGAMALKGPEPLTDAEVLLLDEPIRIQLDYLRKFEQAVVASPPEVLVPAQIPAGYPSEVLIVQEPPAAMSAAQFVARAEQYGNSVWQSSINAGRQTVQAAVQAPAPGQKPLVFMGERRVHYLSLYDHPYCITCKEQSDLGWQPLGSLNEIGDSECGGGCDCYFEWRAPDGAVHVSPWFQRHNPKGYPTESETGMPGEAREGDWIGTQGNGQPTPAKQVGKPPRKIAVKKTPYTKSPKLYRPETPEDVAAKEALAADIAAKNAAVEARKKVLAEAAKPGPTMPLTEPVPTHAEIDAEVKKFLAGQPSKLSITGPERAPIVFEPTPEGYERWE
jgi:hypothetical protein